MLFSRALLVAVLVIGIFNTKIYDVEGDKMNQPWEWGTENRLTDATNPDNPATREQMMVLLHRLYTRKINANAPSDDEAVIRDRLPFTPEEMDILYRIAWAEARGEDDKGLILVINVIMNRIASPEFRNQNTIREVVFAPNQFSPITNGAFDRAQPCQRIKDAVHRALTGEDYSRGALFFNAVRLQDTSWAGRNRTHLFNHGGHSFYA